MLNLEYFWRLCHFWTLSRFGEFSESPAGEIQMNFAE